MRLEDDTHYIYRASIRLQNGRRIYAWKYGLKAFRIRVRRKPPKQLNLPGV